MKAKALKDQLINHLLGALPEAEQTALEQELLADRDKFDEAWAVENDLVDRYVRDELPSAERVRFERHYLASPLHRERVAIAQALLAEIDETPEAIPAQASWWQRWLDVLRMPQLAFGGAMAAALLLTASGALWLFSERSRLHDQLVQLRTESQADAQRRAQELAAQKQSLETAISQERQRSQQLNAELERLRQVEQAAPPVLLSFLLTPATRDQNSAPPPVIPRVKGGLQLLIELGGSKYAGYQIKLQTVEGRALFSPPARATKDRAFVAVTLPAARLVRGDYVVILSGRKANGGTAEIDRYFFRVP